MIDLLMLIAGLFIGHRVGIAIREILTRHHRLKLERVIREAVAKPRWDGWELDDIRWDDDTHVVVVMKQESEEEL